MHDPEYTTDPTADPTADPTYDPTASPSAPTADPTDGPTYDPTVSPTFEPTAYPTVDPSAYPTFEPTAYPTFDPSAYPTSEPTVSPTFDPSAYPTSEPTAYPTVDPTSPWLCKEIFQNDANKDGEQFVGIVTSADQCIQLVQANCDWANIANVHADVGDSEAAGCWCQKGNDMTYDDKSEYINCLFGTPDPTVDPTREPTTSPLCSGATYQGSMSCADGECDELWGGESMASENCDYLLVMEMNGNLAVYAESLDSGGRRLLSSGRPTGWLSGWNSETLIANESGTSVPVFRITEKGTMYIMEYTDGRYGSDFVELWSLKVDVDDNPFTFDLTSDGCLEVNVDSGIEGVDMTYVSLCSEFVGASDTVMVSAGTGEGESVDYVVIVMVALILVICCLVCGCVIMWKRNQRENGKDVADTRGTAVDSEMGHPKVDANSSGLPMVAADARATGIHHATASSVSTVAMGLGPLGKQEGVFAEMTEMKE